MKNKFERVMKTNFQGPDFVLIGEIMDRLEEIEERLSKLEENQEFTLDNP